MKYSDRELLGAVQDFAKANGRQPSAREFGAKNNLPAAHTYVQRFGSFNAGIAAAGLSPTIPNQDKYTDDDLRAALRALASKLGYVPVITDLRFARPHHECYLRRFGSFTKALHAAGIKYNPVKWWLRHSIAYTGIRILQLAKAMREPWNERNS